MRKLTAALPLFTGISVIIYISLHYVPNLEQHVLLIKAKKR